MSHFGGVTVLHQPPVPAFGVGARDPADVAGTLEQNEHVAFEVYAAPLQDTDDTSGLCLASWKRPFWKVSS